MVDGDYESNLVDDDTEDEGDPNERAAAFMRQHGLEGKVILSVLHAAGGAGEEEGGDW